MTLREITTVPAVILKNKAHKVTDFGVALQTLVDDMVETMRLAPGVGLAAPQINVPLRLIVVEFGDEEDEEVPSKLYVLVNPEMARVSEEKISGAEACLSIPGFVGDVERFSSVTVKGQNRHGQSVRIKAKGWLARIFQHEMDHLDGILFTDRATNIHKLEESAGQLMPMD
jgi:peptide deformylase